MDYSNLENCKKQLDETWEEYKVRYNQIVDELNAKMDDSKMPYSKLTCIVSFIK